MAKIKFETVRGMRDFLPEDMIFRDEVISKIKAIFEQYGFSPWEAPALEYESLLKEKTVEEKLIYKFKDRGGRDVVMRPEKTPSLARIIASNPNLPKPIKLYNIGRVWRYDRPQKGRYREFWQADIDIIGNASSSADAEMLACVNKALEIIGLKFTFRISSRKLMNQLLIDAGISQQQIIPTLRIIDKLETIGEDGIGLELQQMGVGKETIAELLDFIRVKGPLSKVLKSFLVDEEIKKELQEFESYLKSFGIKNYIWDLSLVRGLDYYTGFVFEIDAGGGIGSVGGGGRYDNLIGIYSGADAPATGLAIGIERVIDILRPKEKKKTSAKLYIIPINTQEQSIKIAQQIRNAGVNTDIDLQNKGISKNLSYANKLNVPYVLFIGEKELKAKKVKLRDMKTGKEKLMTAAEIIKKLK